MAFEATHFAGTMTIYAASLRNPEDFTPQFHVSHKDKLSWLGLHDDLTCYDTTLLHAARDDGRGDKRDDNA